MKLLFIFLLLGSTCFGQTTGYWLQNSNGTFKLNNVSAPPTPAEGSLLLYSRNDTLRIKNSSGVELTLAETTKALISDSLSGLGVVIINATGVPTSAASGSDVILKSILDGTNIDAVNTSDSTITLNITGAIAPGNGGTGVANNSAMTVTGSGNFAYTRTLTGTTNVTFPTSGTLVQFLESADASTATPTPTGNARENSYDLTALATAPTFAAPSGAASNHNTLLIRIKDNGTARALAWNAIYRASTDFALPATTVINKTMYVYFVYNSADTKWDCVGLTNGF